LELAILRIVGLNTTMAQEPSAASKFELHIAAASSEQSALKLIADNCPLSKQKIKSIMSNGAVWLESDIGIHRIRRAKKILPKGNIIHIYYDEKIQSSEPEPATLIADEKAFSIWSKPYGMYSQGTKWGDHCTIYRWVETHLRPQRPAFLVHRLDRAANGLILIAHSKKMAVTLSSLFSERKIVKQYRATVKGEFDFSLPCSITNDISGKPARSTILACDLNSSGNTVLTVDIKTGRKHQIRKHLAAIGHPVIGDRLYGEAMPEINLQLQSFYLKFNNPLDGTACEYILDD
jgi:tRNA pseudouridine32 synthase/23S rRNA pseudouridine746 synthase